MPKNPELVKLVGWKKKYEISYLRIQITRCTV